MRRDPHLLRVLAAAAGLALAAGAAGGLLAAWLLGSSLAAEDRAHARALLLPHWPLLLLVLAAWVGLAMAVAQAVYRRWRAPPAQLLEQARVLLQAGAVHELPASPALADPVSQGLAQVVNGLVAQRRALQQDVAAQVGEATHALALEHGRLAALMHELLQGVIVCNRDGRILLYNRRARLQFQTLGAAAGAGGQHLIGLGRSIYAVLDPARLQQALDQIQHRLQRGAQAPAARFVVATRAGQWLRVQVAPVLDETPAARPAPPTSPTPIDGFVLMLDNITREAERDSAQAAELHQLALALRAGLGRIGTALQSLPAAPMPVAPAWRAALGAELQALGARLQALDRQGAERLATRWPREDLPGAELVDAALARLQAVLVETGHAAARADLLAVDEDLWLHVDSHTLLQVLEHLARRLLAEFAADPQPPRLQLRLQRQGAQAGLDLVWPGRAMSAETVLGWETEALQTGSGGGVADGSPLTVRDVLQRHGASLGFERDRQRQQAFFRLLLPCAEAPAAPAEPGPEAAAPEAPPLQSYDFDLFQRSAPAPALDDQRLQDLACTVFDTETTGLAPAEGDQILQIGAVRVLRGRVLRHETYERLVDPQRPIPAAGIPIHGITPDMVRGQPRLEQVLPDFHAYAADTVLVAHNAAFDLRFLQLAEGRCDGLRFNHPVLDTLLLSAVLHPQQASHRLEDIARRLGVTVLGRHTALGDALVTAQIFVRLLPLLAAQGIHTLGQAREASRQTYYARLRY